MRNYQNIVEFIYLVEDYRRSITLELERGGFGGCLHERERKLYNYIIETQNGNQCDWNANLHLTQKAADVFESCYNLLTANDEIIKRTDYYLFIFNYLVKCLDEIELTTGITPQTGNGSDGEEEDETTEESKQPQQAAPDSQQEPQGNHKPTRGRGRPKETIKDKMVNDTDGSKLEIIHTLIQGKKGKDAVLILLAAVLKGWMQRPTYTQVINEFGDIGSKTGFNRYFCKKKFADEEVTGAINSLQQ